MQNNTSEPVADLAQDGAVSAPNTKEEVKTEYVTEDQIAVAFAPHIEKILADNAKDEEAGIAHLRSIGCSDMQLDDAIKDVERREKDMKEQLQLLQDRLAEDKVTTADMSEVIKKLDASWKKRSEYMVPGDFYIKVLTWYEERKAKIKAQQELEAEIARSKDVLESSKTEMEIMVAREIIDAMHAAGETLMTADPSKYRKLYVKKINQYVALKNKAMEQDLKSGLRPKKDMLSYYDDFPAAATAEMMIAEGIVRMLRFPNEDLNGNVDMPAMRCTDPKDKVHYGTYILIEKTKGQGSDSTKFATFCRRWNPSAKDAYRVDVVGALAVKLEPDTEFQCAGTSPLLDGVYIKYADDAAKLIKEMYPNRDKRLLDLLHNDTFYKWGDPAIDDLVFLHKIQMDYGDKPYDPDEKQEPVEAPEIPGGYFYVDDWWPQIYDNHSPEDCAALVKADLMWFASLVDPFQRVPMGMFLINSTGTGNNGKGARMELARTILGDCNVMETSLTDFAERFGANGAQNKMLMIMSEITNSDSVKSLDLLKKAITGEWIKIERKYQDPYNAKPTVKVEVQCNELPNLPDKTDAWYRRWGYIPANKSFRGHVNPRIKDVYLKDHRVAQYMLRKLLHMDIREFGLEGGDWEPDIMRRTKGDYKTDVDPIRQFLSQYLTPSNGRMFASDDWRVMPYQILYEAYREFYARTHGRQQCVSMQKFKPRVKTWAVESEMWEATEDDKERIMPNRLNKWYNLDKENALVSEFHLNAVMDKNGSDPDRGPGRLKASLYAKVYYGGLKLKDEFISKDKRADMQPKAEDFFVDLACLSDAKLDALAEAIQIWKANKAKTA